MSQYLCNLAVSCIAILAFFAGCGDSSSTHRVSEKISGWESVQEIKLDSFMEGETEPRTIRVHVANPFDSALALKSIELGCVCLKASLDSESLEPGGSKLTINLKPLSKTGPFSQRMVLRFIDKEEREWLKYILMEGNVTSRIEISPKSLDFGELTVNRRPLELRKIVRVVPHVDSEIVLISQSPRVQVQPVDEEALSPEELVELSLLKQSGSDKTSVGRVLYFVVQLTASSENVPGAYRDEVNVAFDGDVLSGFVVPVQFTIKSFVRAVPQRVVIGNAKAGERTSTSVDLISIDGRRLPKPQVHCGLGSEQFQFGVFESDNGYRLDLTFQPIGTDLYCSNRIDLDFGDFHVSIPFVAQIASEEK